jgi:hypothetical protein
MRRASNWNAAKRNASLTEFRRLLDGHRKEQVQNAIHAGRALAKLVADSVCTIAGIDDVQVERYRRRYAVLPSLKAVMFAVATGQERSDMIVQRIESRRGQPLRKRCQLCARHNCRCVYCPKCNELTWKCKLKGKCEVN